MTSIANIVAPPESNAAEAVHLARTVQREWFHTALRSRLRCIRRLRGLLAKHAAELAHCISPHLDRQIVDTLTAEVLPLADACRFLELESRSLLAPQALAHRSRPFWLNRVEVVLHREPVGTVLVIGPSNYPLFLPAVQTIQALVAGNAVIWKPGHLGRPVALLFRELAITAGFPPAVLVILNEAAEEAIAAICTGVDKVVLTGSVQSGRAVLAEAAGKITPTVMELSGHDALFVLADADLNKVSSALLFGFRLNGGATCIAPRRIFVDRRISAAFTAKLAPDLDITRSSACSLIEFETIEDALAKAAECPYALGASIFGSEAAACQLARHVPAGVVVVNDLIVPTADPRVPFGGSGLSGFGRTRGAAGLLEMTRLRAVITQKSKRLRHLEPLPQNAEQLFLAYLRTMHGASWRGRLSGLRDLLSNLVTAAKPKQ